VFWHLNEPYFIIVWFGKLLIPTNRVQIYLKFLRSYAQNRMTLNDVNSLNITSRKFQNNKMAPALFLHRQCGEAVKACLLLISRTGMRKGINKLQIQILIHTKFNFIKLLHKGASINASRNPQINKEVPRVWRITWILPYQDKHNNTIHTCL